MAVQIPGIAQPYKLPEVAGPLDVLNAQGVQSQNALRNLTVQQGQQEMQSTNAMRQLMAQPGALDKDGLPTPQAINMLWSIDPKAAMTATKEMSGIRNQRATMDMHKVDMAIKQLELGRAEDKGLVDFYESQIANGASPVQATAETNAQQLKRYGELIKQDSTLKPPPPFDLALAQRNMLTAAQQHQELSQARQFAQQQTMQDRRDVIAADREDRRDARQERTIAASEARQARTLAAALGGDGGGKPLTDMAKLNADLAAGRITKEQYDAAQTKKEALTEAQGKGTAFAAMTGHATSVLDRLKNEGFTGETLAQQIQVTNALGEGIPYVPGTGIIQRGVGASAKAQEAAQAQMLWAEAELRFVTGAAAQKDEVVRTAATFFPRSGDTPEVVKQKREARRAMEEAIRIVAGGGEKRIPALPPKTGASGEWKIEKVE